MPEETPKPAAGSAEKKKRTAKSYAVSFWIKIAATVVAVWALLTWVAGVYVCHENAAFPMIRDGDLCITYRLAKLKQGDAIVYRSGKTMRFGRVIALGGDSVEILNDHITVNGYGIYEQTVFSTLPDGSKIDYPYTVPENCVFVLNDDRRIATDSRAEGGILRDEVQGKIVFLIRRRGI